MTEVTRVALVHDWLTGMRGGEYVLEAIAELFPKAELFTLLDIPEKISPALAALKRHTSFLQKIPGAEKHYRHFLPLMPTLIESFDLSGFDLIISSSHCVAKGIRKPPGAIHISYVHAPMRYIWDRYDDYFGPGKASLYLRCAAKMIRGYLKKWDRQASSSHNVDLLIANSYFIAEQMRRAYGRNSKVIYPFAALERFQLPRKPGSHYLMVTAFAPNKRVDLAIEAFNRLKLPLWIVGGGQEKERLHSLTGPTVQFLGQLSNSAISELYSTCRAFIFPGVEDFGITPLEAMASGAPVIAYAEGGVLETVTEKTGAFFKPQTVEVLVELVERFEKGEISFSELDCRERASQFSRQRFQKELLETIHEVCLNAGKDLSYVQ